MTPPLSSHPKEFDCTFGVHADDRHVPITNKMLLDIINDRQHMSYLIYLAGAYPLDEFQVQRGPPGLFEAQLRANATEEKSAEEPVVVKKKPKKATRPRKYKKRGKKRT